MSYLVLDPPLFPDRDIHHVGETGIAAQKALVRWANGGSFHKYGTLRREQPDFEFKEEGGRVEVAGKLWSGVLRWSVSYSRSGEPDNHGHSSGYSSAEDACYGACTMIEQDEREQYETNLVAGLA